MMEQCEVLGCNLPGQRHHIVFRSQGGLDIPINFKYLCPEHHTGKNSTRQQSGRSEIQSRGARKVIFNLYRRNLYNKTNYTDDRT